MKKIKIVTISDTHGFHDNVDIPKCDILIFAGDFSSRGSMRDTDNFLTWFSNQKQATHKIFIAGNHDLCFDSKFEDETGASFWLPDSLLAAKRNCSLHYLENSSVEMMGLKFWGSPITPDFFPQHWAFNKSRGTVINQTWEKIPNDTDVIITHGPCKSIGDFIPNQNKNVGCEDLLNKVNQIVPKLFVCGHIHEGYSLLESNGIIYANSAICDEKYIPINKPHEIILTV